MNENQPNNPLHGISLKTIVEDLVERRGWEDLGSRIRIRCFNEDPSISSSLKFLRKTEWARTKVERLYLDDQRVIERNRKRNARRAAMRAFRAEQEANGIAPNPDQGPIADQLADSNEEAATTSKPSITDD